MCAGAGAWGGGGSEIDAFDEIDEIVEKASLPVPEGLGSKNPKRNETHPLKMTAGPTIELWKVSLSAKWVLNYAT